MVMNPKARNQLTLLQCFCSDSSEPSISPHSSSRVQLDCSICLHSRSASPEFSVGSQDDNRSNLQVSRPIHESICDERVPDSSISISSKSCDYSQTSRGCDEAGDPGQFDDELLLGSDDINTAVIDASEIAEKFVQPGNSDLPSASHSIAQLTSLKTLVILLKHQHFLLLGLVLIGFQQLCLVAKLTHYGLNLMTGWNIQ